MQKKILTTVITVISVILLSAYISTNSAEKISYSEIGSKYVITGPLGMPLGEVVTIEAEKTEVAMKAEPSVMKVLSVNGVKLANPVVMTYHTLLISDNFKTGSIYKFKAYQDGSFTGTPVEVLKEVMFQSADYGFSANLVIYKLL